MSKILRNAWIALAVLALVTMVTACGGSQGSSSSSGNVAAVIKGLDNPFFQAMQLLLAGVRTWSSWTSRWRPWAFARRLASKNLSCGCVPTGLRC